MGIKHRVKIGSPEKNRVDLGWMKSGSFDARGLIQEKSIYHALSASTAWRVRRELRRALEPSARRGRGALYRRPFRNRAAASARASARAVFTTLSIHRLPRGRHRFIGGLQVHQLQALDLVADTGGGFEFQVAGGFAHLAFEVAQGGLEVVA